MMIMIQKKMPEMTKNIFMMNSITSIFSIAFLSFMLMILSFHERGVEH